MAPSPPNESEILTSYLLHPSPLPTILPFNTFLSLLPASTPSSTRHSPGLKRLYRDLQFQREITIDDVRRRIENECSRSAGLLGRLEKQVRREEGERKKSRKGKKRKRSAVEGGNVGGQDDYDTSASEDENVQREIAVDVATDGALGSVLPSARNGSRHQYTTTGLLSGLATAGDSLNAEIADLQLEIERLRAECGEMVGNLSDLRYGRFAQPNGSARVSGDPSLDRDGAGSQAIGGGSLNGSRGLEAEVVGALEALKGHLQKQKLVRGNDDETG